MFYNNNPISTFLDSFYDRSDVNVRALDPAQQFSSTSTGVREFEDSFKRYNVYQQILEQIGGSITTRGNLFARLRNFKDDPLAITIIDILIEDAFSQTENKDFYEITYSPVNNMADEEELDAKSDEEEAEDQIKTEEIQDVINDCEKKFLLKSKFKNILFDLMLLGEWVWSTKYEKTFDKETGGLVEILDNKLIDNVIGIYKGEVINSYIELTNSSTGEANGGIIELDADSVLHLVLNPGTIRFYINEALPNGYNNNTSYGFGSNRLVAGWNSNSNFSSFNNSNSIDDPSNNYRMPVDRPVQGSKMLSKYIRTGRSVLYSSLRVLEKIALLDMTNLALLLKRALSPTIMSIQVPDSFSYKKALEAATAYEQWFYDAQEETQNTFSQTGQDNLNFNRIFELSQKFKCIPVWGDSKGALQTLDFNDTRDNREAIEDLKRELSTTSGLPYYYFNPEAGGQEKKDTLKTHAKYARKLHIIQQSVANSVIEVHYKNLKYKGYNISREDLAVKFKSIVNSDSLESIEEIINLFTALNEIVASLDTYAASQALHVKVVTKAFMRYFRFITQSYPFISDMIEEAPEQELTDNPDLLAGGGMVGMDTNPEELAYAPAEGEIASQPQEEYAEALKLFDASSLDEITSLQESMKVANKKVVKAVHKKLDEAITSQPYRYNGNSSI